MNRLSIILVVSLIVVASGCASSNPTENNDTNSQDIQNVEDSAPKSSDVEDGEPSIHVTSFSVDKEEALIQENVTINFAVKNNGTASGKFEDEVEASLKLTGWTDYSEIKSFEEEIAAGSTKEFSFENKIVDDDNIRFRLEDRTEKVDVKPRNLSIGDSFTNLADVEMTVEELEMKSSYERDEGEYSGDGNFLFVRFTAKNTGNTSTSHIGATRLIVYTLQDDDTGFYEEYGDAEYAVNYKAFNESDLEAGETRTGYLAFEVPYGIDKQDFVVQYHGEVGYGLDQIVNWNR